jgi:hypothetical protein
MINHLIACFLQHTLDARGKQITWLAETGLI